MSSESQSVDSPSNRPTIVLDVTKGYPRIRRSINAGLVVSNDEGRRWWKDTYGKGVKGLPDNHWQDFNVPLRLNRVLLEHGISYGCIFAPRLRDASHTVRGVDDFLVITQHILGAWINDGPEDYEEVLRKEIQPVPTQVEEEVKKWLKKNLGIETCGFKSYFGMD